MAPLAERLQAKIEIGPGCWLWTGATNNKGYGLIGSGQKDILVTHAAWTLAGGCPLPDGFQINHTCDVRACCRADDVGTYSVAGVLYERRGHLWLGTHAANMADMTAKGRHWRHSQ